jgi:metalloendopeptidase OMA1, mitochondrial
MRLERLPKCWFARVMQMRRHFSLLLLAGCLLAVSIGCTTAPVTGRKQLNIFSSSEEMQMGLTSFEQMKQEVKVSNDPQANALLQKVGQKIAAAAANDLPGAQWEFVVFDSPEANAFCLPGGKVGIYTGILPITKDEAGLATVIGHEVAHATARHGGERMSTAAATSIVLGAGAAVVGAVTKDKSSEERKLWNSLYGVGATGTAALTYTLPHSRAQESEADRIGLIYMARAGYDPAEAVNFWQRFADYNRQRGGDVAWFLRTHPLDTKRIQDIQKWIPEARAAAANAQ